MGPGRCYALPCRRRLQLQSSNGLNGFNFLSSSDLTHSTRPPFFLSESPLSPPQGYSERGLYRIYLTQLYHSLPCNTARARYTYTAHKRLIFTAKPPTLCALLVHIKYDLYSVWRARNANLHFTASLNGGGIQAAAFLLLRYNDIIIIID